MKAKSWFLGVAVASAMLACLSAVYAWQPSFSPWQNIDVYNGTAVKAGRIMSLAGGADWQGLPVNGAIMMLGADNGGAERSLDLGKSWETVNGGRGFGDSFCGGYSGTGVPKVCSNGQLGKRFPLLYGGPPIMIAAYCGYDSNVSDFATSALPPGLAAADIDVSGLDPIFGLPSAANGLVYRASNHLYVSTDAAASWLPMSPQCELNMMDVNIESVATDLGRPGHVVVGSVALSAGEINQLEVSGCKRPDDKAVTPDKATGQCSVRTIAWNDDVSREIKALVAATASPLASDTALKTVERAAGGTADSDPTTTTDLAQQNAKKMQWAGQAKWRYASLAHLATGTACTIAPHDVATVPPPVATVPKWTCDRDTDQVCHGRKSEQYKMSPPGSSTALPVDPNAWCMSAVDCACKSDPVDCNYPRIRHLEIDPRNGWVYGITWAIKPGPSWVDYGIVTSPDGGASWMRKGDAGLPKDQTLPPAIANKGLTGAHLLTHQFEGTEASAGAVPLTDANAFDLVAHPESVKEIGRISLSWKPCAGQNVYKSDVTGTSDALDYSNHPRQRGTLVAVVAAEWLSTSGDRASGTFVAIEEDDCQGVRVMPKSLVFRDTANRVVGPNKDVLDATATWVPRKGVPASVRKLARQFPLLSLTPAWVHYGSAAVAPSDNRVLYAWGQSETWLFNNVVAPTTGPPTGTDAGLTGLWRSLNRGQSWSLVTTLTSADMPNWYGTSPELLRDPELSVDPANANRVMISGSVWGNEKDSGSQLAIVLEPTSELYGAGEVPKTDCSKCPAGTCSGKSTYCMPGDESSTPSKKTANGEEVNLFCRKDKVVPDYCALFDGLTGQGIKCARVSSSVGYTLTHCELAEAYNHYSSSCSYLHPSDEPAGSALVAKNLPMNARDPCVACSLEGANLDANGKPLPCCLHWRSLVNTPDPASATCRGSLPELPCPPGSTGGCMTLPVRSRGLGGSGASGLVSTFLPPTLATAGAARATFVGDDDSASGITGAVAAPVAGAVAGAVSGLRIGYKELRAVIAIAAGKVATGDAWFIGNRGDDAAVGTGLYVGQSAKSFFQLHHFSNASQMAGGSALAEDEVIGSILRPDDTHLLNEDGTRTFPKMRFEAQGSFFGLGRAQLVLGGELIYFSAPGIGVVAVPTKTSPIGAFENFVDSGIAKWIPIEVKDANGNATLIDGGTCINGLAISGGRLWAVVPGYYVPAVLGPPVPPPQPHCRNVPSGLYSAPLGTVSKWKPVNVPQGWSWVEPAPVLRRENIAFRDPHAVAATNMFDEAKILVADWLAPENLGVAKDTVCGGGIWLCDIGSNGTTGCRMIYGGDGVEAMATSILPASSTWGANKQVLAFVQQRRYNPDVVAGRENGTGYLSSSTTWTIMLDRPAENQGVHMISLSDFMPQPTPGNLLPAILPVGGALLNCGVKFGLADCSSEPSNLICQSLSLPIAGRQIGGVGRAAANFSSIAVDPAGTGSAVVTSIGGQGNYLWPGFNPSLLPGLAWCDPHCGEPWTWKGVNLRWRCGLVAVNDQCAGLWQSLPGWMQGGIQNPKFSNDWQMIRVPADKWRQGFAELAAIGGEALPDVEFDPAVATAIPEAMGQRQWQFTLADGEVDITAASTRINLMTATTLDRWTGRWYLNGAPLQIAESVPGRQFHASTSSMRRGSNTLVFVCNGETSCSADLTQVKVATGQIFGAWTPDSAALAVDTASYWAHLNPIHGSRFAALAVVELLDAARPTWLTLNGGSRVLVQDGLLVAPAAGTRGSLFRIALPADMVAYDSNRIDIMAMPTGGAPSTPRAGVLSLKLVLEGSDDFDLCLPSPERCADNADNDCNGLTDEASDQLCDSPDPDGCALGRSTCDPSHVCTETLTAPRLMPAPATLQVAPASVTALFEDGGETALINVPQPFDLFTVLQSGAYIPQVIGLQSPQGNHRLTGLRVRLASAPSVPWNNVSTPVSVRSVPTDDGLTFTLTIPGGADISAGHKLILVHDNAPDVLPVNTIFGCPGGELTLPSTLRVRNACDFPNVDCNAVSGPGSACDSNPASPMCPTCTGDYDGCRQGSWLPLGPDGALVCSADQPVQAASPMADILQVTIATATFYYDTGAPVVVAADNQPFDLFLALSTGTLPIAGLVAPMPPAYGAHLRAIRLTLAAGTVAQIPDGQSGWTPVTPRSGSDDTGVDIDLGFGPNGPMLPPGTPIRAMAQSSSSPDGWRASYQCPSGGRTVLRRIDVLTP